MRTQRREEKRVEERASARERERERVHAHGGDRESARFGSSFCMFFPAPWAYPMQIGLARSVVCPS